MAAEHSSTTGVHLHVIQTERIGALNAYVQGDIEAARRSDKGGPPVFLTVHDATKNHNAWLNFVYHPSMANVRERAVFIHVDLLGQEDEAEDIKDPKKYPSMQDFGEDLVNVLDNLRIKMVIGLGEGVGSNILARFAVLHASRCLGVVLISPTVSAATAMNKFKDMLVHRFPKLAEKKEDLLVMHKFGHQLSMDNDDLEDDEDLTRAFDEYKDRIKKARLNLSNSRVLMDSFVQRDDISNKVKSIVDDMLLVCGSKSAYAKETEHMFSLCDKTKTSLLKIDDVSDVLEDAPSKLAHSMLLFCKGLGWLTTLTAPGIERQRSASQSSQGGGDGRTRSISQSSTGSTGEGFNRGRRMSMEDYDKPNIRRLSLKGTE